MQYVIIKAGSLENLVKEVNKRIGEGWKPLGNFTTYSEWYQGDVYFAQTMIKE